MGAVALAVADDQPTYWDRVAAGLWEPGTLAVLDRWLDGDTVFVDLGAWVGPTALYAAALGARVFAVEADPAALDQLARNLAANPTLAERITVIDRAIHPHAGTVTFGARRKPGDSMSSLLLAGAPTTWSAETITPAELAALLPCDGRRFVKIDIEGAEYDLLPHLGPLMDRSEAAVLLSLHPGILAAGRGLDANEIIRRTAAALAPFRGWGAHAVTSAGAEWRTDDAASLDPRREVPETDEWLLVRC
ncbi:FkbM family methyltransferase [Chelatococcus sp. SYSU_G07232]|uniref:FkbM family methyltransferase n=1 Tax=Chelatococcus albus TaxID=3047466 RepID=A0ABT7AJ93_9HYPH|nr:FkbM family methyltransferase [Chelatococcus sp. SYSU_G07232]MDJ1159447.1 FkbM family methyltransferase [Chelatococcus sp. SYSU_G07232]